MSGDISFLRLVVNKWKRKSKNYENKWIMESIIGKIRNHKSFLEIVFYARLKLSLLASYNEKYFINKAWWLIRVIFMNGRW